MLSFTLFAALCLVPSAQADLQDRIPTPGSLGDQFEIGIHIGSGPGQDEPDPGGDPGGEPGSGGKSICVPLNGNCIFCVGTAGPTAIYDELTGDEGLGLGVGTSERGVTVKIGSGVKCPREL